MKLPEDWEQVASPQQTYILTWLLKHDPLQRPSSQELAKSDWLPPLLVEESQMQTLVRNAMKNTSCRAYKHLISAVIGQPMSLDRDVDYDTHSQKVSLRMASAHKQVTQICRRVLELHGALPLDCPHFLPKGRAEDWVYHATDNVVQVRNLKDGVQVDDLLIAGDDPVWGHRQSPLGPANTFCPVPGQDEACPNEEILLWEGAQREESVWAPSEGVD